MFMTWLSYCFYSASHLYFALVLFNPSTFVNPDLVTSPVVLRNCADLLFSYVPKIKFPHVLDKHALVLNRVYWRHQLCAYINTFPTCHNTQQQYNFQKMCIVSLKIHLWAPIKCLCLDWDDVINLLHTEASISTVSLSPVIRLQHYNLAASHKVKSFSRGDIGVDIGGRILLH